MILKNSIDLIILSILNENDKGLTGYALIKQMKLYMTPYRVPSAGTIYPKLSRLKEAGFIDEEDKIFTITDKGKQRLKESIPELLDKSLETVPMIFNILMKSLPFDIRMKYFSMPGFPSYQKHPEKSKEYYDNVFMNELKLDRSLSSSVESLEGFKKKLIKAKEELQKKFEVDMEDIEKKISAVEKKLEECLNERKSWKKVKIEFED